MTCEALCLMIGIHFLTVSSHCLCEVCGGRFPILMIRKLRVRITQAEKGGDRRELSPVWLQERSLPLLQGWAPDHLLCSIPWWNGGKRKGSFAFPSFFLPDAANLIIALYFPVVPAHNAGKENWQSALVCLPGSCSLFPEKPISPWQRD